jgi:hypothetical protein
MLASRPHRGDYRADLGVSERQTLVVVASTWGEHSLFSRQADLLPRLLDELPAERYQVAALLHPAVWFGHGPRQIRSWLADCRNAGLILVEHDHDWRAALLAADHVIGDFGSTAVYAAAAGRPVLLTDAPPREVTERSPHALLGHIAPRLSPARPLTWQLERAAATWSAADSDAIAAKLTSRPAQAARLLREAMYRLLGLPEPGRHRRLAPVGCSGLDDAREVRHG